MCSLLDCCKKGSGLNWVLTQLYNIIRQPIGLTMAYMMAIQCWHTVRVSLGHLLYEYTPVQSPRTVYGPTVLGFNPALALVILRTKPMYNQNTLLYYCRKKEHSQQKKKARKIMADVKVMHNQSPGL